MFVEMLDGQDRGKLVDLRNDVAHRMIAQGRARDPHANTPSREIAVETETRTPLERAVNRGKPRR